MSRDSEDRDGIFDDEEIIIENLSPEEIERELTRGSKRVQDESTYLDFV